LTPEGVNFCVYSRSATHLDLLLFDHVDDDGPGRVIQLDPRRNRTHNYWHVFLPGIQAGQLYAFRAHGPVEPNRGLRFDGDKVLLDPYGRGVAVPDNYSRQAAGFPGDNTGQAMKSVVIDTQSYDWGGDRPLQRRFGETIIYEMHVRGFTRHPSSGVPEARRGTYAGLIDKIPYLQELGVTAVELLPIFQYDPQDAPPGLINYWGYSPVSFFAPHLYYSSNPDPQAAVDEFRDMVKALHQAGIEVILDVVYNHTAEGDERGPTFCFKGLENEDYYILQPADPQHYANFSGTGNTLNGNHTAVRRLILDSLRYWVETMHVDGFRFDLASILSRDESGCPMANPPILWDIENDPVLAGTKLIAEAWDAAGLYQVGSFVGNYWKEWNGHFRDDVRAFLKSDPGMVEVVANRFFASPDIYGHKNREPEQSINFITCHDGFTLNDLVSYNQKQNWENGEEDRDGHNHNLSWNCGAEGPSDDLAVERRRRRQIKNFFTLTLLSLGVPMLSMGDEVRILRFARKLIHFRLSLPVAAKEHGLSLWELLHRSRITFHGVRLHQPDTGYASRSLAISVWGAQTVFHLILNAYWDALDFELPSLTEKGRLGWRRIIDTTLESPDDFNDFEGAPFVEAETYHAGPRSLVLLCRENPPGH